MAHIRIALLNKVVKELPPEEQEELIKRGAFLRLTELKKRLDIAKLRIKEFGIKYRTTFTELSKRGLPETAGYEMHEDFMEWKHWIKVSQETDRIIKKISKII